MKEGRKKNIDIRDTIYPLQTWMIFYLILSVASDIIIRITDIPYFVVSDIYIGVVFAAICTVATLGSAIQSIVIGSFSSKIYGLTVKEVLAAKATKIDIVKVVEFSFAGILVGLFFFAKNCCTTVTAIAVCVICIIAKSSIQIWKLLSDDKRKKYALTEILKSGIYTPEFFFMHWFIELEEAIKNNDVVVQDIYIELIRSVSDEHSDREDYCAALEKHIKDIFPLSAVRLGFVDAYRKVICFGEWNNKNVDVMAIVQEYYLEIKYCNEQEIGRYRIPETVDDILERMDVPDDDKMRYAFDFYRAIKSNQVITRNIWDTIIDSVFSKLCYLRDYGSGCLRERILLYIAKYDFFENENVEERKKLWVMLTSNLFRHNRVFSDNCYISLMAQLFRALYFYSVYEVETLNSSYRDELLSLLEYGERRKDNYIVSLAGLVKERAEAVVKWLADDCNEGFFQRTNLFEYFSADCIAKSVVWTHERCLLFAFKFYLLHGYRFQLFPIKEMVENNDINRFYRIKICQTIVNCFDHEGKLTDSFRGEIMDLRTCIGLEYSLGDALAKGNFNYFNGKLIELNKQKNDTLASTTSNNIDELNKKLTEEYPKVQGLEYCDTLDLASAPSISIKPRIRPRSGCDFSIVIGEILQYVEHAINHELGSILPKESISFDQSGVEKLLLMLAGGDYKARNYQFVDDLALSEEVRLLPEYIRLCEVLQQIPFIDGVALHRRVFIKKEHILFNAKVLSYKTERPTDAQCEEYITSFKVADGKYRIDGAVLDYSKALSYTKSSRVVEYLEICAATNMNNESGFEVTLSH